MAGNDSGALERIKGRFGTYTLVERLDGGGNGEVFRINIEDKKEELPKAKGYVIKKLILDDKKGDEEKKKRKERFYREISAVCGLQDEIEGIIPIWDSSVTDSDREYDFDWYLMPLAEKYKRPQHVSVCLKHMHKVAETIKNLHGKEIMHRDIKPNNLMWYNNRVCITDFGLVWSDKEDSNLTTFYDHLGPASIRPPELESGMRADLIDYKKSDVYLFAKTLWIFLTDCKR